MGEKCHSCQGTGTVWDTEVTTCPACNGWGEVEKTCMNCGGTGEIEKMARTGEMGFVPCTCDFGTVKEPCQRCGGAGELHEDIALDCSVCSDTGEIKSENHSAGEGDDAGKYTADVCESCGAEIIDESDDYEQTMELTTPFEDSLRVLVQFCSNCDNNLTLQELRNK